MRVTEVLRGVGGFDVELSESAPRWLQDRMRGSVAEYSPFHRARLFRGGGQIVVFPTRTLNPSINDSIWAGQILSYSGGLSYAGEGITAYLTRSNGIGLHNSTSTPTRTATQSMADWLTDEFVLPNNMTLGTITDGRLATIPATVANGQSYREVLDMLCDIDGNVDWVMSPGFELSVGPPDVLFRDRETILVEGLRSDTGLVPAEIGCRVTGHQVSIADCANQVRYYGGGDGDQVVDVLFSVGIGVAPGANGSLVPGGAAYYAVVDASGATEADLLELETVAQQRAYARDEFSLTVDNLPQFRAHVAAGDTVHLVAPTVQSTNGTNSLVGAPVFAAGQTMYAEVHRVTTIVWSPPPGKWSVYFRDVNDVDGGEWFDITDLVVPGETSAELRLTSGSGPVTWASLPGQSARLGTTETSLL